MSLTEIIAELPALSIADRQLLIRRTLDLDDPMLSAEDEAEIERRLAEHRLAPDSAILLDEMRARLRSRFAE
jgi:putative addiction module component (TIGR02574 family)